MWLPVTAPPTWSAPMKPVGAGGRCWGRAGGGGGRCGVGWGTDHSCQHALGIAAKYGLRRLKRKNKKTGGRGGKTNRLMRLTNTFDLLAIKDSRHVTSTDEISKDTGPTFENRAAKMDLLSCCPSRCPSRCPCTCRCTCTCSRNSRQPLLSLPFLGVSETATCQ